MKLGQKIRQFAANRRAMRELEQLEDHVLSDIGISRAHIRAAVLAGSRV